MNGKKESRLNANANFFIISDAHVGAHTARDRCNYDKLIPFLKDVFKNTQAVLVLNGDFFDFSRSVKKNVLKNNPEIVQILNEMEKSNRLIKLKGNHDICLNGERQLLLDNSILVLHGDIFEKTTSLLRWIGMFIDLGVSFMETIFRTNINRVLKNVFGYDRITKRGIKIEKKAVKFLQEHPQYQKIIVGHSHTPQSSSRYYNSGCFTERNSDYIEITASSIQLKSY